MVPPPCFDACLIEETTVFLFPVLELNSLYLSNSVIRISRINVYFADDIELYYILKLAFY